MKEAPGSAPGLLHFSLDEARSLRDFDRSFQLEADGRFGWQSDVAIPGEGRSSCSGSSTDQGADSRSLPAPRQRADQRTRTGSPADHRRRALALSFLRALYRRGLDGMAPPVYAH